MTVEAEIRDLAVLVQACKRLGWEFRVGQTRHKWYGRWVDDSPVPRHLFATEEEYQAVLRMPKHARVAFMGSLLNNCHHTIHIPGKEYEVGVFAVEDRWELSYDWVGDLNDVLGCPGSAVVNPLPQAYALELERSLALERGYHVTETVEADGTVQLTCTSYGSF